MNNNINVAVGGPINADYPKVYKTKFLKPGIPFSLQVTEPNTKYVIKHNFDLKGESVTIPEGCLLEFDGGALSNGTLVGQNTILIYNQELDTIFHTVTRQGTFVYNNTVSADEEDITEVGNILKLKDRGTADGMGKIIFRKNKTFAEQLTQENTIYVIQYDFDLGGSSVTIPANCVLEFDGGSISGGSLNLNGAELTGSVSITSEPAWNEQNEFWEVYKPKNLLLKTSWFGAKGDGVTDDAPAIIRAIKWLHKEGSTLIFDICGTYILGDGIQDLENDPDMTLHTGYSYDPNCACITGQGWGDVDAHMSRRDYIYQHRANIGRNISLVFFRFTHLTIDGNGSILKSHDNNGYCRNNSFFVFYGCENFTLKNLTIDANKTGRPYVQNNYPRDYSFGTIITSYNDIVNNDSLYDIKQIEYMWSGGVGSRDVSCDYKAVSNIYIKFSSSFTIKNVVSSESLMDGIRIESWGGYISENFIVENCVFEYAGRGNFNGAGMSNGMIKNCLFQYAGYLKDKTTVSIASIQQHNVDLENENLQYVNRYLKFVDCSFKETHGVGFVFNFFTQHCTIDSCSFENTNVLAPRNIGCFLNKVKNSYFYNSNCDVIGQEGFEVYNNRFVAEDKFIKFGNDSLGTYDGEFVYGMVTDGTNKLSCVPSRFCNNIIECHWTSEPSVKQALLIGYYNLIMDDNTFINCSENNLGTIVLQARSFNGNKIVKDTETYPWLSSSFHVRPLKDFDDSISINTPGKLDWNYFSCKKGDCIEYDISLYFVGVKWLYIPYNYFNIQINTSVESANIIYGSTGGGYNAYGYISNLRKSLDIVGYYGPTFKGAYIKLNNMVYPHLKIKAYNSNKTINNNIVLNSAPDLSGITKVEFTNLENVVDNPISTINGYVAIPAYLSKNLKKLCIQASDNTGMLTSDGWPVSFATRGTTAQRPTLTEDMDGFEYYDTTLHLFIHWNGTSWVDATGTSV